MDRLIHGVVVKLKSQLFGFCCAANPFCGLHTNWLDYVVHLDHL